MPCLRHFRSQTYYYFDRYRLLYKRVGRTIILTIVLCATAATNTVFSFKDG